MMYLNFLYVMMFTTLALEIYAGDTNKRSSDILGLVEDEYNSVFGGSNTQPPARSSKVSSIYNNVLPSDAPPSLLFTFPYGGTGKRKASKARELDTLGGVSLLDYRKPRAGEDDLGSVADDGDLSGLDEDKRALDTLGSMQLHGYKRHFDTLGDMQLHGYKRALDTLGNMQIHGYKRSLDSLGGMNIHGYYKRYPFDYGYKRSFDSLGGAFLPAYKRQLSSLGGAQIHDGFKRDDEMEKRYLSSLGGANVFKRSFDSLGGMNLHDGHKRFLSTLGGTNIHMGGANKRLSSLGGTNVHGVKHDAANNDNETPDKRSFDALGGSW